MENNEYISLLKEGRNYEKKKNYFRAFDNYCKVIRHSSRPENENKKIYKKAINLHDNLFKRLFFKNGRLISINKNPLIKNFRKEDKIREHVKKHYENGMIDDKIFVIKEKKENEKGILCLNFTKAIELFLFIKDPFKIKNDYKIVIMASWTEYHDPLYYCFIGSGLDVFISCQYKPDFNFIKSIKTNLIPIKIGQGDMIKPFSINPQKKVYDICAIGYSDEYKRYSLLLEFISKIKSNKKLSLLFLSKKGDLEKIKEICNKRNIKSKIESGWFPEKKLHIMLAKSKVFILNSTKEGHNRLLTESLFANTPIMMNESVIGNNHDFINPETGFTFNSKNFKKRLLYLLKNYNKFSPNEWASKNTGSYNACRILNDEIKKQSLKKGEPWTKDIAQFSFNIHLQYQNKEGNSLGKIKIKPDYKL